MSKKVWNHNYAYHNWISKNINNNSNVLDVGCGDGTLIWKIREKCKNVFGIDMDTKSIDIAENNNKYDNVYFINDDFLKYDFGNIKFDSIIFVASIHHMNMDNALIKAKSLLNNNGKIIIVGLSKPSSITDYIIEIFRVLPSFVISKIKRNKTSEEMNIETNYSFPTSDEVRNTCKKILKENYKIKYALHYRYLLLWTKKES